MYIAGLCIHIKEKGVSFERGLEALQGRPIESELLRIGQLGLGLGELVEGDPSLRVEEVGKGAGVLLDAVDVICGIVEEVEVNVGGGSTGAGPTVGQRLLRLQRLVHNVDGPGLGPRLVGQGVALATTVHKQRKDGLARLDAGPGVGLGLVERLAAGTHERDDDGRSAERNVLVGGVERLVQVGHDSHVLGHQGVDEPPGLVGVGEARLHQFARATGGDDRHNHFVVSHNLADIRPAVDDSIFNQEYQTSPYVPMATNPIRFVRPL